MSARRHAPTTLAVALLVLAAGAAPRQGHAQLRIIPQAGLYVPVSDLPDPATAVEIGEREASFAYGLGLELGGSGTLGLRLNVLRATDSEIPIIGDIGCEGSGCARSTLTAATVTATLRPLPELALLRPYFLIGGGVKRYDFDAADLEDEGVKAVLSDENSFTGHLGLGLEFDLGAFTLAAELSDIVGTFDPDEDVDGDVQHDMLLTLGLVLGGG